MGYIEFDSQQYGDLSGTIRNGFKIPPGVPFDKGYFIGYYVFGSSNTVSKRFPSVFRH
jgi:hypothetical protein